MEPRKRANETPGGLSIAPSDRARRAFAGALLVGVALFGTTAPANAQITGVATAVAGFVGQAEQGPLEQPTLVQSWSAFLTIFGGGTSGLTNPHLAPSVRAFFENGGGRLWVVRVAGADDASLIGSAAFGGSPATGLQALGGIDEVGVVAIPGATSQAVHVAMLAQCEGLADRVCLLDPASRDDATAVLAERAGLSSPQGFGTLYFPWIEAAPSGVPLELPPSGFVAGVIARNDSTRGVWRAPAGPNVGTLIGATGLTYAVSNAEQELLNPEGINAIRFLSGAGLVVWGSRTLSTNVDWRFLSVRRFVAFVDESVQEGTEYALFEPNDATLWSRIEDDVETFLQSLFVQGALAGTTAEDAYFVRCDVTTMTPVDLAEGRTIVLVGLAVLRPAEFVVSQIVQRRAPAPAVPALPGAGLVALGGLLVGTGVWAQRRENAC